MTATDPETPNNGEHQDDATNKGQSAQTPAEGGDDAPGRDDGSPQDAAH
jgi:hypothetical protein